MKRLVPLFFGCLLTGCGFNGCQSKQAEALPETIAELRDVAISSRAEASTARAAKEYEKATAAAKHAEAAAEKAASVLAASANPTDADRAAKSETSSAAKEARHFARLAEEDERLAKLLKSWTGTAYRSGRTFAFSASCTGLAQAADQAALTDLKDLPEPVRDSAKVAADVAHQYTGRKPLANGQPDWPQVAADLRRVSGAPPPEMAMAVAVGFLLGKKKEFALYEIEIVEPASIPDDRKPVYHVLRGFIYSSNGLPLLAREEIARAPRLGKNADMVGPEVLAGVHLFLAYLALDSKDYVEADREIVCALRAWPNNPVAVFLMGERQAATGEYEKAAVSLENALQGTDSEWLAKRIAQRARELRDNPGKSDSLLLDHSLLCELCVHSLAIAAKNSEAARKAGDAIAAAREFSQKIVQNLPGQ